MYLISKLFVKKQDGRYALPRGFHVVNDLVGLLNIKESLIRSTISKTAKLRLAWMDYYRKHGSVVKTCRYFGISRETFYSWRRRYDPQNLTTLEDQSKAPKRKRQRAISPEEKERVIALRTKYIRYGKMKLAKRYAECYGATISSWKIQKVIEQRQLYYHPKNTARIAAKRKRTIKKVRITTLKRRIARHGFLLALDTIVIYWNGTKRYIFTAIDRHSRVAFAWMYPSKSSRHAADFLSRLTELWENQKFRMQHDNGSEFHGAFQQECTAHGIAQYWSRVKTPKDNAVNERFNRTLQEEFVNLGNFTPDCDVFNRKLVAWLVEYNFRRPHQSLSYKTPMSVAYPQEAPLSTMYSSST
jgi:transposase InsO family protein